MGLFLGLSHLQDHTTKEAQISWDSMRHSVQEIYNLGSYVNTSNKVSKLYPHPGDSYPIITMVPPLW
jgi:hypothetical protein